MGKYMYLHVHVSPGHNSTSAGQASALCCEVCVAVPDSGGVAVDYCWHWLGSCKSYCGAAGWFERRRRHCLSWFSCRFLASCLLVLLLPIIIPRFLCHVTFSLLVVSCFSNIPPMFVYHLTPAMKPGTLTCLSDWQLLSGLNVAAAVVFASFTDLALNLIPILNLPQF